MACMGIHSDQTKPVRENKASWQHLLLCAAHWYLFKKLLQLADATMFSNTSDRSGFKKNSSSLMLRKRQESAERQNQLRDES